MEARECTESSLTIIYQITLLSNVNIKDVHLICLEYFGIKSDVEKEVSAWHEKYYYIVKVL